MTEQHRYKLASNKVKKIDCPHCGAKKHWQRYIDNETGEILPDEHGRCDNSNKCGAWITPKETGYAKTVWEQQKGYATNDWRYQKTKPHFYIVHESKGANTELYNEQLFTEIKAFGKGNSPDSVITYHSVNTLCKRLNKIADSEKGKFDDPAVLKGIYKDGTSGEYCINNSPFLFFDIDVKENENPILLDPSINEDVFTWLQKRSILIWRSNSRKGISGLLFTPQLQDVKDNEKHLQIAKEIYKHIEAALLKDLNKAIHFDTAQGKFRQIRFLAKQNRARTVNLDCRSFHYSLIDFKPYPKQVLSDTLKGYEQNTFIQNLLANLPFPFDEKDIEQLVSQYLLGTVSNGYWAGAVTFPFIDENGNVRTIQEKLFNEHNSTDKTKKYNTGWTHSRIEYELKPNTPDWINEYKKNEKLVSCLFGAHLLKQFPYNPIALVEAPKTAIYGALYFGLPDKKNNTNLLWLAVYNKSSLTLDKCKALAGRNVVLFPDLGAFDEWSAKAARLEKQIKDTQFTVSGLLEDNATEQDKLNGYDLADYLIKQDWRRFRPEKSTEPPPPEPISKQPEKGVVGVPNVDEINRIFSDEPKPTKTDTWCKEIEQLETFFTETELPKESIRLNAWTGVSNLSEFIEKHLKTVKEYNGNKVFKPYLNRLTRLKEVLT